VTIALHFPSTLRTRIVLTTGSVLLFLLLAISQVLLFQWREVIIAKQYDAVMAVSKTFEVRVIDALIHEERSGGGREGVLQTYVDDFVRTLGSIRYVAIADDAGQPLAVSPALATGTIPWRPTARLPMGVPAVRIFDDPSFHWVIEIRFPLRIGRKSWGGATIGFDAAPIRDEIRSLFFLLFVTTMLVSGGTLVVLSLFAGRLTASLNRLVKEMDSADLVKGTTRPALRTDDDVAFLFERFDLMRHRIDQSRTQIEMAQREVYQAEKLASIGRLASGVAHQVNNPLNGIRSCLYAIGKEPDNALQTREYVDMINEEITHIESVVQKLLGFARPQMQAAGEIDIGLSTRKVVELFDVRLREKQIHLAVDLPENLPAVAIDYHLFQEVVMNLLLNGYDAVGRGGKIRVEARALDPATVVLRVRDDGVGISPENLERIFEPFFTTKEIGTGTGLGLSVCQSIVEQHGGKIAVTSMPGEGTEFTVVLPTGGGR
jgi:two-component system, NtrC family, sensor kinase